MSSMTTRPSNRRNDVVVRHLVERDLDQADLIFRTAFGTFMGAAEPERFFGDTDLVRTRWRADPTAAFAAELDGELVGSNLVTNWGSVGFFGPLTVRPDCWDRGIAKQLLEPTMDLFASWKTRHVGLLTFAESPKHVGLYQSFGFWPRYLIAAMAAPVVAPVPAGTPGRAVAYTRFSEVASHDRAGLTSDVSVSSPPPSSMAWMSPGKSTRCSTRISARRCSSPTPRACRQWRYATSVPEPRPAATRAT